MGFIALLGVYFGVLTLVSGWSFTLSQFSRFWYFIAGLALGFGLQIGLYNYLKNAIHQSVPRGVIAVSGTTSTVAMVSCCAHYLANILPVLAVSGVATFVGQYQVELFLVGLLFNLTGIVFIGSRIYKFEKARQ